MRNSRKTKKQLIDELKDLYEKLAELKVSERFLREANDELSVYFDAIQSTVGGIIITDNDGRITHINPSFLRMFGYDRQSDIIGRDASRLFFGEEIKHLTDVQVIIDLSDGHTEEFTARKQNGKTFVVEVASSNVTNSRDSIVGKMVSFVDITGRKQLEQERENIIQKLQDALEKVKTLSGLLPICSACKKIRDDKGYWNEVDSYIHSHSGINFTHSICPECSKRLYPKIFGEKEKE
jgi:PAS domain S-box-containing protein